jgi:hypothetical protein
MGGRASLMLVMGFSLLFLIAGQKFSSTRSENADNMYQYYASIKAEQIASSAINKVMGEVYKDFRNPNEYKANLSGFLGSGCHFLDGYVTVNISPLPGGTTPGSLLISSTSKYQGVTKIVEVKVDIPNYSIFAYMSDSEGGDIWWTGKDVVTGPFHTNDNIRFAAHPQFLGSSTTYGGKIIYQTSKTADEPIVTGHFGHDTHPWPPEENIQDLKEFALAGGHVFTGKSTVFIVFKGDSLTYRYKSTDKGTTVLTSEFAPNGSLFVDNGALLIEGKVKGNLTVGASGNTAYSTGNMAQASPGNVFITNNLTYFDTPDFVHGTGSTDMLGIMAEQNTLIERNYTNEHLFDIDIYASIFCQKGGFGVEDYQNFAKSNGEINLRGGIVQGIRRAVGTFSTDYKGNITISSGRSKDYLYDQRLLFQSPPFFPSTNKFRVLSWMTFTKLD